MRKIITTITCLFFCAISVAQHISFDEMIKLRKQSFSEVNDYLISKGWVYDHSTATETVWRNGLNFFRYAPFIDSTTQVCYQPESKSQYDALMISIKSKGMKLTKTYQKDEAFEGNFYQSIVNRYEGKYYIVNCKIISDGGEKNGFNFTLAPK